MKFNNGFNNVNVELRQWSGEDFAKQVYEFGRMSHDFIEPLPHDYEENNPDCIKLIDKIIAGTTLPKYALQGTRINFAIEKISRICLAQITRDSAIFASAGGGVFPLTQEFNLPMSIYKDESIMNKLTKAQKLLESAYIEACEKEIPNLEARYIGLHCQVISLTASYTPSDFVRSCYSRTSSNFCDECNYVYRLMYHELNKAINMLKDHNSKRLWQWIVSENKCINDKLYLRERLYNSDFTYLDYKDGDNTKSSLNVTTKALNDWRRSGWKLELERMHDEQPWLLTEYEKKCVVAWKKWGLSELKTTYDSNQKDVCKNAIKNMDYYNESKGIE